jgi:hypothetical protein
VGEEIKQWITCKESAPFAFLDVAASAAAQSASSSSAAVLSADLPSLPGLHGLSLPSPLSAAVAFPETLLAPAVLVGLSVDNAPLPEQFKGWRGHDEGSGEICIGLYSGVNDAEHALKTFADCGDGVSPFFTPLCLPLPLCGLSAGSVTCAQSEESR